VSVWGEVFLGVIAVATLAMALVQVGLIVAAVWLARRVARLADQVENELKPLFANVNTMSHDASRAVALATLQVERADRLFSDVVVRIEQALNALQSGFMAPALEGRALLVALRAVIDAIRHARPRSRRGRGEDDDALFI
jgi:enoyl reductase-like protein